MSNSNIYTGTGFSHNIPFSDYAMLSVEEILNKYDDTSYSAEQTGYCSYVVDGDTLDFIPDNETESIRIRLVGINTPESDANGYACSKQFLAKLCLYQNISINVDSEKEEDNYGRKLAIVILNNKNINEILLKEGLAEVMSIPPSEFNPKTSLNENTENELHTENSSQK